MIKLITFVCSIMLGASLMAQSMPSTTPHLQGASQQGQSRLRFIVHVYDAALYAPAGFKAETPFAQSIALAVAPGRAFRAESILKQMVKELKRQDLPEATIAKYEAEFAAVLPAVEEGDTLTGVFTPKQGWALWFKGKRIGQWADESFAKAFFNIWLGTNASQAVVRSELLKL